MKIKTVKLKETSEIIKVRWDSINCVWINFNHRGVYHSEELEFFKEWDDELDNKDFQKIYFYLDDVNVHNRLLKEFEQHGKLIIAVDFDNTLFDYHKEGNSYDIVINLLRRLKKIGMEIIIWTGSAKSRYDFIREYLNENNIPFDRINENPVFFKSDSPKIFYSILLDDRAGLNSACRVLELLCDTIEKSHEEEKTSIFPTEEDIYLK